MNLSIIIDVILVAIIWIAATIGYKKGLIKTVYSLVAFRDIEANKYECIHRSENIHEFKEKGSYEVLVQEMLSVIHEEDRDKYLRELEELEQKYPEYSYSDSPTKRVGGEVIYFSGFTEVDSNDFYAFAGSNLCIFIVLYFFGHFFFPLLELVACRHSYL